MRVMHHTATELFVPRQRLAATLLTPDHVVDDVAATEPYERVVKTPARLRTGGHVLCDLCVLCTPFARLILGPGKTKPRACWIMVTFAGYEQVQKA